jgi:hypothetical protein
MNQNKIFKNYLQLNSELNSSADRMRRIMSRQTRNWKSTASRGRKSSSSQKKIPPPNSGTYPTS